MPTNQPTNSELIIIYGAGGTGAYVLETLTAESFNGERKFIFTDSNDSVWGTTVYNTPVISPSEISGYDYNRVIPATTSGYEVIIRRLINEFSVPRNKIDLSIMHDLWLSTFDARTNFLRNFADIVYKEHLQGMTAEGGVASGDFAKIINKFFPDRGVALV
jgi:FlaA1/EpsC-like NDP-sugar epimerase